MPAVRLPAMQRDLPAIWADVGRSACQPASLGQPASEPCMYNFFIYLFIYLFIYSVLAASMQMSQCFSMSQQQHH
jgi:hypothetical protein